MSSVITMANADSGAFSGGGGSGGGMNYVGMQVMARITGLVGMFLGNSRRSEWFTSVVVGLWTNAWP